MSQIPDSILLQHEILKNWAGNFTYGTNNISYPASMDELTEMINRSPKLKALGSRHCFNKIADSSHHLVSMKDFNRLIALDTAAKTVTIEGGINYGQLCPQLHEAGFALH